MTGGMEPPLTLHRAAARIAAAALKPSDLLGQCLARIDRFESEVHAWVVVDRARAVAAAERADAQIAAGRYLGALHGIPVGIKDIVDVAGLPTRAGSTLTSDLPVTADAAIVAALRAAGAIILGKTVTTEFACFDPAPTRNPWNLNHTPGGSSSGSAAAVALGMCLAAIGTQTGGSITRPATYCGGSGWKPTFDLISRSGVTPVSEHLDHVGFIARRAMDLQRIAWALGYTATQPAEREQRPAELALEKIAVVEPFFLEESSEEVRLVFLAAIETLEHAGVRIERIDLPVGFAECHRWHRVIMAVEAAAVHSGAYTSDRARMGPNLAGLIAEGLAISTTEYQAALAFQRQFRRDVAQWCRPFAAVLSPATNTTAPATLTTTGDPRFNSPWSLAGVPTVSTACGIGSSGMSVGWQWIGSPDADGQLLGVAAGGETRLGLELGMPTA